jgi:hypothetical protein
MTEYLRKDMSLGSERTGIPDPNKVEKISERPPQGESEVRTYAVPPPADPPRSTSSNAPPAAVVAAGAAAAVARAPEPEEHVALFTVDESAELRTRWNSIQVSFVDEPRKAVQEADALVSDTMKRLAEIFSDERQKLEQQWDRSENISTEDFRLALRRYRSFFGRLLAI